jgi:hypothetical protein
VTLLKAKLRPALGPDDAKLDRLVKDLDSEQFEVREKASAELDRFGESVVAGVRHRLTAAVSPEIRRRLELFLEKQDIGKATPQRLRRWRALELLKQFASDDAKALLRQLAQGSSAAPQTREARAALARLEQRHRSP